MVDLATIPHANAIPTVTAPTTKVTNAQIASPHLELASTLATGAKVTEDIAKRQAYEEGLKSVTLDAEGNVQVQKPFVVGAAADELQKGVKYAALAQGEHISKQAVIEQRAKFRDNPQGFQEWATEFREAKVAQFGESAGTEVGIALGKVIDAQATQVYTGLVNEHEALTLKRTTDAITANIAAGKNEAWALSRGGADPEGPEMDAAIGKVSAGLGRMGANPRLSYPPEKIAQELAEFKGELGINRIQYNADKILKEQGFEAAVEYAKKVRTDTSLNLTGAERETAYNRTLSQLRVERQQADVDARAHHAALSDVSKQVSDGFLPGPAVKQQLASNAATTTDPERRVQINAVRDQINFAETARKETPWDLQGRVQEIGNRLRDNENPSDRAMYQTGVRLLNTMRKELESDPLSWGDKVGVVKVPPLDFTNAATLPGQMRDRIAIAESTASYYGRKTPTYLRPDEKDMLERATSAGGKTMLDTAKMLTQGFGDRAPRVIAEVAEKAPILAHLGGLLTSGGDASFAQDAADSIKLQQDKEFKLPPYMVRDKEKVLNAQSARSRELYGDAFTQAGDFGRAAEDTARQAFFSRAMRGGLDPELVPSASKTAYDRALQESAGARYIGGTRYGGVTDYSFSQSGKWFNQSKHVMVPSDIKADSFRDVVRAITDDDIKAMPSKPMTAGGKFYSAADLHSALPVAVQGGYRFAMGDPTGPDPKYVKGSDGKMFVLDIARMPQLRQRVPKAFIGGE